MHELAREVLVLWLQIVAEVGKFKFTRRLNFFGK